VAGLQVVGVGIVGVVGVVGKSFDERLSESIFIKGLSKLPLLQNANCKTRSGFHASYTVSTENDTFLVFLDENRLTRITRRR